MPVISPLKNSFRLVMAVVLSGFDSYLFSFLASLASPASTDMSAVVSSKSFCDSDDPFFSPLDYFIVVIDIFLDGLTVSKY